MYKYSMKILTNKVKILALKYTSLLGNSQRLEVGFGLFRIIFTLPKLKQGTCPIKTQRKILQLKWNCQCHCTRQHEPFLWTIHFFFLKIGQSERALAYSYVIKNDVSTIRQSFSSWKVNFFSIWKWPLNGQKVVFLTYLIFIVKSISKHFLIWVM